MNPQPDLIPRQPRRMKQPRKDVLREQLAPRRGRDRTTAHAVVAAHFQEEAMTIPAYPLRWPPGWKRTDRTGAPARVS